MVIPSLFKVIVICFFFNVNGPGVEEEEFFLSKNEMADYVQMLRTIYPWKSDIKRVEVRVYKLSDDFKTDRTYTDEIYGTDEVYGKGNRYRHLRYGPVLAFIAVPEYFFRWEAK